MGKTIGISDLVWNISCHLKFKSVTEYRLEVENDVIESFSRRRYAAVGALGWSLRSLFQNREREDSETVFVGLVVGTSLTMIMCARPRLLSAAPGPGPAQCLTRPSSRHSAPRTARSPPGASWQVSWKSLIFAKLWLNSMQVFFNGMKVGQSLCRCKGTFRGTFCF